MIPIERKTVNRDYIHMGEDAVALQRLKEGRINGRHAPKDLGEIPILRASGV
jgi:hypothetical protein